MPTDINAAITRKTAEKARAEQDIMAVSVWAIAYLMILAMGVANQTLPQAIELAARY